MKNTFVSNNLTKMFGKPFQNGWLGLWHTQLRYYPAEMLVFVRVCLGLSQRAKIGRRQCFDLDSIYFHTFLPILLKKVPLCIEFYHNRRRITYMETRHWAEIPKQSRR